jgi:DNA-binding transcriptional MerR regulator
MGVMAERAEPSAPASTTRSKTGTERLGDAGGAGSGGVAGPANTGPPGGAGSQRYRIDDLAHLAGTTVRNVRAYQDRGLLPPPDKVGRVGWYSEAHLGRLRLIGEMLGRGYSLANIGELIDGWVRGQDLTELLGLEAALIAPWGEDRSSVYTRAQLRELFAPLGPDHLDEAINLGMITDEGDDRLRVSDPRLIEGATVLVEAGVPFDAVFRLGAEIVTATDGIARMYVETVSRYVVGTGTEPLTPDEIRRLSAVVSRLRPLAKSVVDAGLSAALERRIGEEVGRRLTRSISPERKAAS